MRILSFLALVVVICSCNNNLTQIGQDMVDNESYVFLEKQEIFETYTMKIDSFVTSRYYSSDPAITTLMAGRYSDDISGTTVATPYFQVAPSGSTDLSSTFIFDSLTFNFKLNGKLWGDTINPRLQTFYLYRLAEVPKLNSDQKNVFYNTHTVPLAEKLATASFFSKKEGVSKAYFKLDYNFGLQLFQDMQNRSPNFDSQSAFVLFFKGLAMVPDESNDCMIPIAAIPDSLYLRFHYHKTEDKSTLDFNLAMTELQFNNIKTILPPKFDALRKQEDKVSIEETDYSIAQGLNGYMLKIDLPLPKITGEYTTLVKAELELRPMIMSNPIISEPPYLYVYRSNKKNDLVQMIMNGQEPLRAELRIDPLNKEENRYVINLTDYYQALLGEALWPESTNQLILTIPNVGSSYNRLIVNKIPVLKLYYATYN